MEISPRDGHVIDDDDPPEWRPFILFSLPIVGIIVFGGWIYFRPYMVLSHIREAAKNEDNVALSELVDFPSLRESVTETVRTKLMQETTTTGKDPFGVAMKSAVDKSVDATVSPSGIAAMALGKHPITGISSKPARQSDPRENKGRSRNVKDAWSEEHMGYVGWSTFAVRYVDKETGQDAIVLTLRRHGLSWQLSSARMPLILNTKPEESRTP
jgi:hypothetical protein